MTNQFDLFLQTNLRAAEYNELSKLMQVSPHRLTKIKKNPALLTFQEAIFLSNLTRTTLETISEKALLV